MDKCLDDIIKEDRLDENWLGTKEGEDWWLDNVYSPIIGCNKKVFGRYNYKYVLRDLYKNNYDKIHHNYDDALFFNKVRDFYIKSYFESDEKVLFFKRLKYFLSIADTKNFGVNLQCFLLSYKSRKDVEISKKERAELRAKRREEKQLELSKKMAAREERNAARQEKFKAAEIKKMLKKDYGSDLTNSLFVL